MSSSRFFTWTKGDRSNAAEVLKPGRIVPIPIECIALKGMDYSRREKVSHDHIERMFSYC